MLCGHGNEILFLPGWKKVNQGVVYNNDSGALTVRSEEEAYEKIAEELGVKTLKLGYMPEDMRFEDVSIGVGYGKMRYKYKDKKVFFVQTKVDKTTSKSHSSDAKEEHKIWNSGLHMNIVVCSEIIEPGEWGYMAQFVYNGVYYYLSGVMERTDFDEMLKKIHF